MKAHSRFAITARFRPFPRPGHSVQRIAAGMLLGLATLGWGSQALHAQDIVVPNDLAKTDGNTSFTTPEGTVNGLRFMDMYDASQFQALTKPAYLTGFTLRPDQTPGASGPRTIRARIYVSTTRRSLAEFSPQFSDNIGDDNTLVFDGTLVVSTANLPGPGNTREFDYAWRFTTPFLYDPTAGNLVVDVQVIQSSGSATRLDGVVGSPVSRQLSAPGSPTAVTGQFSGWGNVTRLSFASALPITIRTSEVELCRESVPDATYRVEWRSEVSPGDWRPLVELEEAEIAGGMPAEELLALDEALTELEGVDPVGAKIVQLRFFGGLTQAQIAECLGVSLATVGRSWAFSRVWLFRKVRSLAAAD